MFLFGAEMWVLTQRMEKALDRFQSRFARRLMRRQPRRKKYGRWDYPPLAEALGEAGLERKGKTIARTHNTLAKNIATQPILDLCKRATQGPGARVSRGWWEQVRIDLEGARKRAAESTTRLETEEEAESDGEPNGIAGG